MIENDCTCDECGEALGPPGALLYDGAEVSCLGCCGVFQVSADSDGMHITFLGAPCCYCGALTAEGAPCAPYCGASAEEVDEFFAEVMQITGRPRHADPS